MRLLRAHADAVRAYADMIDKALELTGLGLESELLVLRSRCRMAWQEVEEARITLYRHEADHLCSLPAR